MMFYVYIIKSIDSDFRYTGYTSDLKSRFAKHNSGGNKSTAKYRPFKIIFYEAYCSKKDARRREKFLKSGRGREVILKQIEDSLNAGIV